MVSDITGSQGLININPVLLILIFTWLIIWKALALWKAARKNSKIWFVVLLVVNTLGILEVLYIFLFSKINLETNPQINKKKRR